MADIRVRVGQQNAIKVVAGATPGIPGHQGVQGTQGLSKQGTQGLSGSFAGQGTQGLIGSSGIFGGVSFNYLFTTTLLDPSGPGANPSSGRIGFEESDITDATLMHISSHDKNGTEIYSYLLNITNNVSNAYIRISKLLDASIFAVYRLSESVINNGSYFIFPCLYQVGSNPVFANGDELVISFQVNGIQGTQGVASGETLWRYEVTGISTTSSVGIATTNPQATLDVRGNASISGIVTAYNFVGFATGLIGISHGNTHYVSTDGNDLNDGTTLSSPYKTIKHALSLASSGDDVSIGAGTFTEIFPLTVPQGVSINGAGIRGTFIQPTEETKQNDCFLMNGETEVTDLSIGNYYEPGWGFRFAPNMKTTLRSPYIQRVTILNRGTGVTTADPYGFNTVHNPTSSYKSGRGILIDGSVVDPTTLEPTMLFNECTFITPNNIALEMTNGARTELVNCFAYFADKAIYGHSGNVGLGSTGKTRVKISGITTISVPSENDLLYYFDENLKSGTYSRVGTGVTVTFADHGLSNNDKVNLDFTGPGVGNIAQDSGIYAISGITSNTFNVTTVGSGTTSGTLTYKKVVGFGTINSYSNGTIILKGKGNGIFATASSRSGKQVIAYSDAKVSTTQFKFGTGSALFGGVTDYLQVAANSDFSFGIGSFTIECFIRLNNNGKSQTVLDMRDGLTSDTAPNIIITSGNVLKYNVAGSAVITGSTALSNNVWYHVALSRSGSYTRLFLNGIQEGITYTDPNVYLTKPLRIGSDPSIGDPFDGYIDEVRISNTARYTTSFTPTTTQFNSDTNTKLLLHCDGDSGSVIFNDSTLVTQDVRIVSPTGIGSTSLLSATEITLADYQQFGAEMRSIGSAAVFGNTGATADGLGVNLRLFAFNFGHVGSGGDFSQDESLVIQGNEVIEENGGKVLYVSIDQKGDFRVGNTFYVSEEKGFVSFGGQTFNIASLSNLEVTDGTYSSILTPTSLTSGNIQLNGNEITTTSGDLDINPSGISSTRVVGDLTVTGVLNYNLLAGSDGDKGDITVSNNFATWSIDNNVVNFNKLQNISSAKVLGRTTAGVGTVEQLSTTGTGNVVLSTSPTLSNIDVTGVSTFAVVNSSYFNGLYSGIGSFSELKISGITTINAPTVSAASSISAIYLNQTWNTTGVATAIAINITNTASDFGSNIIDLRVNNNTVAAIDSVGNMSSAIFKVLGTFGVEPAIMNTFGISLNSSSYIGFTNSSQASGFADVYLYRDGSGVLGQRNSSNPQTFRVYNTYSGFSGYEAGYLGWNNSVLEIGVAVSGMGSSKPIHIMSGVSTAVAITTSGSVGIGTTVPLSKLDVRGDITLGTSGINTIASVENDIVAWEYFGTNFSVASQDTNPNDIYFRDDGTKMFIVGSTNDRVYEYALSSAWNVSSAGFTTFFSTASQETDPNGLYFKPDGTAMYISGITGVAAGGLVASADYVHQYTLSTPWSIAAGSVGYTTSFRILEDASPIGCFISTDGTKLYVAGATNDRVYQYNLSTPWSLAAGNVSFASSISVASQDTNVTGVDFNSTGTIMWVSGSTNDRIYQYNLSTPWTLSSAIFYDSVYVGHQDLTPAGVCVESAQNKVYICGSSNDTVYQYNADTSAIHIKSSGISTASAIVLRNDVRALDNMSVRGRFTVNGITNFNSTVQIDGILSLSGAFNSTANISHTGTTTILSNSTATNITNIATGVVVSGSTKTINVGTGGAAGSRLLVTVGSATAGTASTVVINSGTSVVIGSSTTTGTPSQPLQVTGGAYISSDVGIGTTVPDSRLQVVGGDIRVGVNTSHGIVLTSPNGTKYRLIVDNSGVLSTTPVV